MNNFFNVQNVAIIGASPNRAKLGWQLMHNLIEGGYAGKIVPVNLDDKEILGHRAYQTILDYHGRLDMAVIIIPREVVPLVLKQCVEREIAYVLIISAGFAEKDTVGKHLQDEIKKITAGTKTKIIGPNCLGIINTENKLNLTFAATKVRAGGIGMVLQSGAIGSAILDWANENNLGISKFISLGNEVNITETESLEILKNDEQTKVIALYLEQIIDPKKFFVICKAVSKIKPIIVLKGGETEEGSKAASTHTAALSAPHELNSALFSQANLIEAKGFEQLIHFLELFSSKSFKMENSLAIVSNAGGPAILAADAAFENNLKIPKVSSALKRQLKKSLENFASLENPFDLGGDAKAKDYRHALDLIIASPLYSSVLAIITPQTATELDRTALVLAKFRKSRKPIIATFLGGYKIKSAEKILKQFRIPHYEDPALAVEIFAKIENYFRKKALNSELISINTNNPRTGAGEAELINRYGIPFAPTHHVNNDGETMGYAEKIGFPLVFKTAKNIKNRGKSGKVGLNIADNSSLTRAIAIIGYPAFIQKMISSPFEIFISAKKTAGYGIALYFGQGGIFVEQNRDVSTKILPLTESDLDEMIKETKIWPEIKQFKVLPEIKKTLTGVAKLMLENTDIETIEFNPFKVLDNRIVAVDVNITRQND